MSPTRPPVQVVGRRLEPEHHRLRDFLTRLAQPYEWLEAGSPEAAGLLGALRLLDAPLPLVVDGDRTFAGASVEVLAAALGRLSPPKRPHYDLVVIGAGPAGLAAAVYAASDGLSTIVFEHDVPGGQASHTSLIENKGRRSRVQMRAEVSTGHPARLRRTSLDRLRERRRCARFARTEPSVSRGRACALVARPER